jgi:hypothetical protein
MKLLKQLLLLFSVGVLVYACSSSPIKNKPAKEQPVVIANDSLEYQIIIIDIGFTLYLNTVAKPMSYHSQSYLENKNIFYVSAWNERARNPIRYNHNIYENVIDYNSNVDYGLEVNYKLYWYFKFAEQKYKMSLR